MNRRLILEALLVAASLPLSSIAHADQPDTVILANGGKLRGTVLESDPKGETTIRLVDSTTRTLKRGEVARVEYAERATAAPAALPPSAPPIPSPDVPEGRHVEYRSIEAWWITGLVVDLSVWAIRAGLTVAQCSSYTGDEHGCNGRDYGGAATPVIGGWIQASQGIGGEHGGSSAAFEALIASGAVETTAFGFFIAGLVAHRRVVVDGEDQATLKIGPVRFMPTVGAKSAGAIGTF